MSVHSQISPKPAPMPLPGSPRPASNSGARSIHVPPIRPQVAVGIRVREGAIERLVTDAEEFIQAQITEFIQFRIRLRLIRTNCSRLCPLTTDSTTRVAKPEIEALEVILPNGSSFKVALELIFDDSVDLNYLIRTMIRRRLAK